jgi:hypothetical protein
LAPYSPLRDPQARLLLDVTIKPETLAELGEEQQDEPPFPLGILPGDRDRYIVTDGPAKGMRGYFTRNADGEIDAIHVGGRLAVRVP